jgi:hypothetical protein
MTKRILPIHLLIALAAPSIASADTPSRPAPVTRSIHLEITDPGDPAGGLDLTTSLIGERACTTITTDDHTTRRKVELCAMGDASAPYLEMRLERNGAAGSVDVEFASVAPLGKKTRLGKLALDAKKSIEAHATVTSDAP